MVIYRCPDDVPSSKFLIPNAGQGVYTITNKEDLKGFMDIDHQYDKFIVQSLVRNASISSVTLAGKFYHVGTIPKKRNHKFVSYLRMMLSIGVDDLIDTYIQTVISVIAIDKMAHRLMKKDGNAVQDVKQTSVVQSEFV
ncbi:hypothetical protein BC830DRAFT_1167492 [Chytriomyces sp. MP71]|nr:hypothetical protein BC830DRAFT_1167492 [Chytriomyces sp. MP71]